MDYCQTIPDPQNVFKLYNKVAEHNTVRINKFGKICWFLSFSWCLFSLAMQAHKVTMFSASSNRRVCVLKVTNVIQPTLTTDLSSWIRQLTPTTKQHCDSVQHCASTNRGTDVCHARTYALRYKLPRYWLRGWSEQQRKRHGGWRSVLLWRSLHADDHQRLLYRLRNMHK